ncbi:MAG: recombinase RecX, partial [Flavobacterium sp.]
FRIKKWGKNRIIRELKARDISQYNIKLALKEIPESEYLVAFHELSEKRWTQLTTETNIQKKKKKFADYLLYRGWESHLIWEKLGDLVALRA